MKKRVLAMMIGLAMVAGLVIGCAGNGGGNDGDRQPAADAGTEDAGTDDAGEDDAGVDDAGADDAGADEVNGDDGIPVALDVLEVFLDHTWLPINSFEGIIPDYIRERAQVEFDVTVATSGEQLGVMIAAGDTPELVFTSQELNRLSHPNVSMSFTYLMENHGLVLPDVRQERIDIARSLSDDGDFYTLLMHFNTPDEWAELAMGAPGQPVAYFRADLLEEIGLDGFSISSVEELMDVLAEVRDAFPDHVPLGLGGVHKFSFLEHAMNVLNTQYDRETGNWYYIATSPNYRAFLEVANRMYREGFVTAEAFANESEADSHQQAFNDEVVFYVWFLHFGDFVRLRAETQNLHPHAEWGLLPPLGDGIVNTSRGWSGLFVSRNVSNPGAAARFLTFIHSLDGQRAGRWGRYGIDYTMGADGIPIFSEEYIQIRGEGRFDEVFNGWFYFGTTAIQELYGHVGGLDPETMDQISAYGRNIIALPEIGISAPATGSDMGIITARLDELRRTHEAAIIFTDSDAAFEAAYQEFMDALDASGVWELNEYRTNAIRETRESLGW